jgi:hypothetical protein
MLGSSGVSAQLASSNEGLSSMKSEVVIITECVTLPLCIDTRQQTDELNVNLQGGNKLVGEVLDKITAFERKFQLWELHHIIEQCDSLHNSENGKVHCC